MLFPTLADAAALADIQIKSFRQAYAGILPDTYLKGMDAKNIAVDFGQKINDPEKYLIMARVGNAVAGYAYLTAQRMAELPFAAELIELYVHPAHTRKGIGKKLFRDAVMLCTDNGWASLNVWVLAANQGACGFYESLNGVKLIQGDIYWPDIEDHTFDAPVITGREQPLPQPTMPPAFPHNACPHVRGLWMAMV